MTAPNGAVSTAVYDKADQLIESYLPMDTESGDERKASAGAVVARTGAAGVRADVAGGRAAGGDRAAFGQEHQAVRARAAVGPGESDGRRRPPSLS